MQLAAENKQGSLLPGGYAQDSFDMPAHSEHLNIPPSALIFTKTGIQVATVDAQNKVVIKPVVVAKDHGVRLELLSGLESTDRVIENPPDGVMEGDLVNVAVAAGVIEKAGSWFSYGELRLGQGKEKAAEALRERPELLEEIRAKVLERSDQVVLAAGEDEGE